MTPNTPFSKLNHLTQKLQTQFGWKLMISYIIVAMVGIFTLALAAESMVPAAFNRHMLAMQQMVSNTTNDTKLEQMHIDLYTSFKAAFTEALFIATIAATVGAIIVSYFISRRVIIPIRQMMQASQYIAAGHYQKRVDTISDDELGQLGHSFNQMAAKLEQTETRRRDLIANVTHELRTPLASIKGYMEGMIDGVLPAEVETYQQIYHQADRLQRLVNDLQELSKVEAEAFELNRHSFDIINLIQQVTTHLHPQFEEKGVNLTLNLPATLPPLIADEDRINQILLNLIGNALQYTPTNGTVSIKAALQTTPKAILITIRDTGLGIPLEHQAHIFTRFYRVDKSRSRIGGGSGIGLTIAKYLVEAHHGQIWVKSDGPQQGSIFGFWLPLNPKIFTQSS